jgi:hypothetical protein
MAWRRFLREVFDACDSESDLDLAQELFDLFA